jgi:hypothetical protein
MAFDQPTRNRLSKFVSDTRKLLSDEFAQQMRVKYGLDPATGVVTDIDKLPTMAEGDRQTAQMLRDTLEHYLATAPKRDKKTIATTIDRIVREQAFTVLNRLCAVRMAESRDLVIESIAQGTKSKGFQLYARLAGSALGETGEAYVCYLFSLFDELSIDLPVLFDRFSPSGRLFPRESVLLDVLGQINHHELQHLWAEDETIGWIYQYFNSEAERKKMRKESSTPRNSRELAVRNQFFTPRYVVEFLTDNTLGRIWYEITQGQTRLVDDCKYFVRRPDEVFLSHMTSKNQTHPSNGTIAMADLLLSGTEETFPEFNANDPQPMIELAHCVSAYTTMGDRAHEILGNETLMVRERSIREPSEITDAVESAPYVFAGQLETLATQHILEVLFMTCRNDRHGGDGSAYSESWFVDACNEVRRRVLNSRRDDLSQEELLRQPTFIPYRPMKDPRDIKMLDPACGSMHFGLYAFDLFSTIYEEAWELEERLGDQAFVRPREHKSLRDSYGTREKYILDVPRLIIERNIHGIDIDARAVQIAGLSLWLRAQKAWHEAGVKPAARPKITRSNIVCAEPMPGESGLLEQFITDHLSQTSEQQTVASIVRRVFDAMQLAGEAGSLLKIEEEIADTIVEAKKKWIEGPMALQLPLFAIDAKQKDAGARPLLVAGIDDASFWDEVEERIYSSLRKYGEQTGGGLQRRLFADDTAQGFAFIDLCRKRYDVVVMNPPFGAFCMASKTYAAEKFPNSANDIFGAFVDCFLSRLIESGMVGAITSRTGFFIASFADWRREIVNKRARMICFVDLGGGVMDNATVEAAVYVFRRPASQESQDKASPFIRLLKHQDKEPILAQAIHELAEGRSQPNRVFWADKKQFGMLPDAPLVYWANPKTLGKLAKLPSFEPSAAQVRKGLRTGDNFRFVRALWEIPIKDFTPAISAENSPLERENSKWVPLVLSGSSQPWFSPLLVALNWRANGRELRQYVTKYGSPSRLIQAEDFYFRPGMSWTLRAARFVPYAIPSGCIPTGSRPMAFPNKGFEVEALAVSASRLASAFMRFYGDWFSRPKFLEGKVKLFPWPALPSSVSNQLNVLVRHEVDKRRVGYQGHEPFFDFIKPFSLQGSENNGSISIDWATLLGSDVEATVEKAYGLDPSAAAELHQELDEALAVRSFIADSDDDEADDDEGAEMLLECSERSQIEAVASHALGCVFGRWDIRYATGERPVPELPDPFAPLPVCPPGMLQGDDGLPLSRAAGIRLHAEGRYPVDVAWDGVLVDDQEHPADLERRVHAALAVLWGDDADAIEHKACEQFGVPNLREWFRKPSGFFADHLSRYSKSRRQAPIYWPLSTDSGDYTLWIYYHRLTDQTLFTAVNEFIDPKLKDAKDNLNTLRTKTNRTIEDENALERLNNVSSDLDDFRNDLLRIAEFWKPNLNDGVQITAAPLWKFFRLKKWRDTLKKTWEELESGDYDWAHLALSIWPDRVVRTAHKDRSIAIAHGLDANLWHEVKVKKTSKTGRVTTKVEWQPRELSEKELDAIAAKVKSGELGTDSASPAEAVNV